MPLKDDVQNWNPMFIGQSVADSGGHIVTADQWNNYWNLIRTQGDDSAQALHNLRNLLFETIYDAENAAESISFSYLDMLATNVSDALKELETMHNADVLALQAHWTSNDHDCRYNTKAEITSALALKANLASPTFTGTVSGITKAMVGLSNVDNTSDLNKPISNAVQAALDTKVALANTTPFTPTQPYHLVTKLFQEQKIAEAVLSGIADNSITDGKMHPSNKKAVIVAEAVAAVLPQIPPGAFDFDTPAGKTGWAYTLSGAGPVTEQYLDGATVKCSRVTSFNTPTAGKTQVVITTPEGKVVTQVFNADGTANPITEV